MLKHWWGLRITNSGSLLWVMGSSVQWIPNVDLPEFNNMKFAREIQKIVSHAIILLVTRGTRSLPH